MPMGLSKTGCHFALHVECLEDRFAPAGLPWLESAVSLEPRFEQVREQADVFVDVRADQPARFEAAPIQGLPAQHNAGEFDDVADAVAQALWGKDDSGASAKDVATPDGTSDYVVWECKDSSPVQSRSRPDWQPVAVVLLALGWPQKDQDLGPRLSVGLDSAPRGFGWTRLRLLREAWQQRRPPPTRFPPWEHLQEMNDSKGRRDVCLFCFTPASAASSSNRTSSSSCTA
ncbi:MAG: hypothetical protein L0Y72_01230 [Gemmataceae bacterium]|nr:hypothetical protein [Gemmataceae bacterium]MCI0737635.1 hypothetical protein [Gemmataceae bacterium]